MGRALFRHLTHALGTGRLKCFAGTQANPGADRDTDRLGYAAVREDHLRRDLTIAKDLGVELTRVVWSDPADLEQAGEVAAAFRRGFLALPLKHTRVFSPGPALARLYGGPCSASRPNQVAHDLFVTEVFLRRRLLDPLTDTQWVGEAAFARDSRTDWKFVPVCDSMLFDGERYTTSVEFVADYQASRLVRLFDHAHALGTVLELWGVT